jgi:hypothetical protein
LSDVDLASATGVVRALAFGLGRFGGFVQHHPQGGGRQRTHKAAIASRHRQFRVLTV